MAYHGFVEQDGKYAIFMDRADVKALLCILGAQSCSRPSGEREVLQDMWEDYRELGFLQNEVSNSHIHCRRATEEDAVIENWYYKET